MASGFSWSQRAGLLSPYRLTKTL
uniref:Uncharacterized protein n=1 Tax=Anguilla anguilla TaxID=7936 RepID=A0A0E9P969_ANGAN